MLDSLDTLISFALIFTVVSLLITIVVQMISSFLNLRGSNLAWGISEAFEAIAPDLAKTAQTAAQGFPEKLGQWLEKNFPRFFPVISKAKTLADHCLNDTLISDSQFMGFKGMASAVRTDELFDLLHRIATGKREPSNPEIKQHAIALFQALGVPANVFTLAAPETATLQALQQNLTAGLALLPAGPAKDAMQKALDDATTRLTTSAVGAAQTAARWTALGEDKIKLIYQQFEQWFETGQERAQEWFTTHARIVTGLLGLAFAILLQLDTIEIYQLVSSNRDLRASLVAQVKMVTTQGEKILAANPPGPKPADATAANEAVKAQLNNEVADYQSVKGDLDKTGFALFPTTLWGRWDAQHWIGHRKSHCLGICFSALLLSLGAPFWFNALKNLASLRSSVAGNISDEKKVDEQTGKANEPTLPPPTV